MQGLRLEIQQRYFSMELLLHGSGLPRPTVAENALVRKYPVISGGRNGFRSVGRESDIIVKARSEAGVW